MHIQTQTLSQMATSHQKGDGMKKVRSDHREKASGYKKSGESAIMVLNLGDASPAA